MNNRSLGSLPFEAAMSVLLALVTILQVACDGRRDRQSITLQKPDKLLIEYRSYSPTLVAPSPGGNLVLSLNKYSDNPETQGLTITEAISARIVATMRSPDPILRIRWRPDGKAIAYFRQERATNRRRLYIWDLSEDTHREVSIPLTYAQAAVRWSPDGTKLAYTSDRGGLLITDIPTGETAELHRGEKVASFDWNTHSTCIVAAIWNTEFANRIEVTSISDFSTLARVELENRIEVREVAWQNGTNILARTSSRSYLRSAPRDDLIALDPVSGKTTYLELPAANCWEPIWFREGERFLWHRREIDGRQNIVVSNLLHGSGHWSAQLEGSVNFREFTPEGDGVIAVQTSPTINRFILMPVYGGPDSIKALASDEGARVQTKSRRVIISETSANEVTIHLTQNLTERANAAIIRVHGGSVSFWATWAETQLCLKRGIDVIHIGNRQPFGGSDLIAACDYVHSSLLIPRERIVVIGASTATKLIIEAASRRPDCAGTLVLIGTAGGISAEARSGAKNGRPRIIAFHGGSDRTVAHAAARQRLQDVFGAGALEPPRGLWHVFTGEDHTLKHDESWASVYSTIFATLETR